MSTWQVQHAKSHFSELLEKAETEGPQTITRHGTEKAVVMSMQEYRRLSGQKKSFVQHLLDIPKIDDPDEIFYRNKSSPREIVFPWDEEQT